MLIGVGTGGRARHFRSISKIHGQEPLSALLVERRLGQSFARGNASRRSGGVCLYPHAPKSNTHQPHPQSAVSIAFHSAGKVKASRWPIAGFAALSRWSRLPGCRVLCRPSAKQGWRHRCPPESCRNLPLVISREIWLARADIVGDTNQQTSCRHSFADPRDFSRSAASWKMAS